MAFVVAGVWAAPSVAFAQEAAGSRPVVTMVALAALSIVPFLFMAATSFAKISVVLSILRNALGTGQVPSGTILSGLAVILSLYVMTPVGQEIAEVAGPAAARIDADDPTSSGSIDAFLEALDAGEEPLRDFLERNAGDHERALFLDLARRSRDADRRDEVTGRDLLVLLPAFLVTELKEAFAIGFVILLPFLVIDLVVANLLLAMGMMMVSPQVFSLPLKLLLFVLIDLWGKILGGLVANYA